MSLTKKVAIVLGVTCSVAVGLTACTNSSAGATARFDSAVAISRSSSVGTAPMFAVSRDGHEAVVWVSAPDGGAAGSLFLNVDGKQASTLRDAIGPIEAHGEAPPKLVYGGDGSLNVVYVVGKEVPGKRFPLAALRFARSVDGGKTWSVPVTVTDDSSTFGSHNFHALHASADGTLYVSWLDGRHGKSSAYVTRSTDGGRTWAPNVRVSVTEACPCCRTALATGVDGTLYLAWRQVYPGNVRDVVVARSNDKGATWSEPVRVHEDNWVFDACPHAGPSLQVDGAGRVHVAWWTGKEGAAGVYYTRSNDGAKTFDTPVALGVAQFSRPAHVQLAVDDSVVAAVWDDGTLATPQVVLRASHDGGKTFGDVERLSAPGKAAAFPVLGMTRTGVAVAWSEEDSAVATMREHSHPDMKDPHAVMKMEPVGEAQVMVRRGTLGGAAPRVANSASFRPLGVGDIAPRYEAVSLSGDTLRVGGAPQPVTLVNVWATWCESCREEFADLDRISRDYAKRGVRVVAVSVDQGSSAGVTRFVKAVRPSFPVAHDPAGRIQRLYAAVGVPSTYVVGADGRVAWRLTGNLHADPEQVRRELDKALTR